LISTVPAGAADFYAERAIDPRARPSAVLDVVYTAPLRTLEQHGLVELVEERRKGNVTERLLQAAAASYVISPAGTVRFASAADRAAFTAELMQAVTSLVAKYHDEAAARPEPHGQGAGHRPGADRVLQYPGLEGK
jgi:hypothetical protein